MYNVKSKYESKYIVKANVKM